MEDELRLFLLLGGTVFIIGVLAHGIWKIRKNTKRDEKPRITPRQWSEDPLDNDALEEDLSKESHGFDDLGIGAVRVVDVADRDNEHADESKTVNNYEAADDADHIGTNGSHSESLETSEYPSDNHDSEQSVKSDSDGTDEDSKQKASETPPQPKPKLYGSVVTNPKPHMAGNARGSFDSVSGTTSSAQTNVTQFPEPPGFLLKEGASEPIESVKIDASSGIKREPSFNEMADSSDKHDEKLAREVSDFSLDAPETPHDLTEENKELQNKRFSRHKRSRTPIRKREEPNFGDDQMRIDFDESHGSGNYNEEAFSANGDAQAETSSSNASSSSQGGSAEQEVLVLNVRAPADDPISGAALLPMLLTLGFKFGDQDIFHRHVNSNGKGPVLFSLANMFKPGVFDIDNLETFETQGVSLFMILPIEGDPHQVFNMMHNAARKIADEFGAQVLDGRRSVLTKQGLQQYVEKIREFERKRMIPRN